LNTEREDFKKGVGWKHLLSGALSYWWKNVRAEQDPGTILLMKIEKKKKKRGTGGALRGCVMRGKEYGTLKN